MADIMEIVIMDDGTFQIDTEGISGKNHKSADEFLEMLEDLAGGDRKTKSKGKHHHHHHHHKGKEVHHKH